MHMCTYLYTQAGTGWGETSFGKCHCGGTVTFKESCDAVAKEIKYV